MHQTHGSGLGGQFGGQLSGSSTEDEQGQQELVESAGELLHVHTGGHPGAGQLYPSSASAMQATSAAGSQLDVTIPPSAAPQQPLAELQFMPAEQQQQQQQPIMRQFYAIQQPSAAEPLSMIDPSPVAQPLSAQQGGPGGSISFDR